MLDVIFSIFDFFPLVLLFIGLGLGGIGLLAERKHEAKLLEREAASQSFLVWDLSAIPEGTVEGQLVSGSIVMGTGYIRQLFASFRQLFGGEVEGFQKVLTRARREAQLRMVEEAQAQGASGVINVRFETSNLGGQRQPISEIFCYGTMIR